MGGDFRPRRYAVRFRPPRFILEYSDDAGKTRTRSVSVSVPEHAPDADAIAREVTRAFPRRLDRSLVRHPQIVRLARRLVDAVSAGAGEKTTPEFAEDLDLNLVSPEKLVEAKAAMDEGFERNRKAIGDEGFEYDVRRDFAPTRKSEWDDASDDASDDDVDDLLP